MGKLVGTLVEHWGNVGINIGGNIGGDIGGNIRGTLV